MSSASRSAACGHRKSSRSTRRGGQHRTARSSEDVAPCLAKSHLELRDGHRYGQGLGDRVAAVVQERVHLHRQSKARERRGHLMCEEREARRARGTPSRAVLLSPRAPTHRRDVGVDAALEEVGARRAVLVRKADAVVGRVRHVGAPGVDRQVPAVTDVMTASRRCLDGSPRGVARPLRRCHKARHSRSDAPQPHERREVGVGHLLEQPREDLRRWRQRGAAREEVIPKYAPASSRRSALGRRTSMTTACCGRNMELTSAAPCAAMRMPVPAIFSTCSAIGKSRAEGGRRVDGCDKKASAGQWQRGPSRTRYARAAPAA
jgi:hypothetical protein